MILIDNKGYTEPSVNLALEEYVVRNYRDGEDYLMLYRNRESVILGKHQNVLEEVDLQVVSEHAIPIARRISGGGTVYHDLGNLNVCFITGYDAKKYNNYAYFLDPIVKALAGLNIEARLNNRNSLVIHDGRKISGNAQFTSKDRMLSHGTLLYNANLERLNAVLKPSSRDITSHAVQSVRSDVVNIGDVVEDRMSFEQFHRHIQDSLLGEDQTVRELREDEWAEVLRLADMKYRSWEWTIGRSPRYKISHRIQSGEQEFFVALTIEDGLVSNVGVDPSNEQIPDEELLDNVSRKLLGRRYFFGLRNEQFDSETIKQ